MANQEQKPPPFDARSQVLSARHLNMLRSAIPRLITGGHGVNVAKMGDRFVISVIPERGTPPPTAALASITAIHKTYLMCSKDGAAVAVAKPWGLRWGVVFPSGVTYDYDATDYGLRTADPTGDAEEQRITPDYEVGEELLIRRVPSSRIFEDGGGPMIVWIDENIMGRCWAAV